MVLPQPTGVHLVGSVPLEDAEDVFRAASESVGRHVRRLPDGETGVRTNWISWQIGPLSAADGVEAVDGPGGRPSVGVKDGVRAEDIEFRPLGYARAALESWTVFDRLSRAGAIRPGVRFQVCLPTPIAPVFSFIAMPDRGTVEPAYERAMLGELHDILDAIPHDRLAMQWDAAIEFALLEDLAPVWFENTHDGVMERLLRLGAQVPPDVELGYHLCYGDAGHRHFTEPRDASKLVAVANELSSGLSRRLDWVHWPVPRSRSDAGYLAPAKALRLGPETELYVGLVHLTDGEDGTRRRIELARDALDGVVDSFGIATACGFGRRPRETVRPLLDLHARLARALDER